MVLEESISEGRRTPKGYAPDDGLSILPASLGPGAISSNQPEIKTAMQMTPSELLRQVQDIRTHYTIDYQDSTLNMGYDLDGATRRYTLPMDKLPLSGPTKWLLYGGAMRTRVTGTFVIDTIRGAENMAGRPLTQSEAEGYAMHASRRTVYSFASSISALGIGTGMGLWGMSTQKFPFRKPKPLERYNVFPNRWLPILSGKYAQSMWHGTRASLYIVLTLLLLSPLYASIGDSAMMVRLYRDTRTHEITKGMADAIKKNGGAINRHTSNRPGAGQLLTQVMKTQDDTDDNYKASEQGNANDYGGQDYSGDTAYTDGSTDTGMLGDSQMQSREASQSSPSSFTGNPAFRKKPNHQSENDFDSSSDSDYGFDDASPTAGNDPDMSPGTSSGGGSTWARIRGGHPTDGNKRGVKPPGRQAKQLSIARQLQQNSAQDEHETRGDSFSFSSSDEDKQLAKEQAQKEFDQMLDQERRGVENAGSSSGTGGSAWGRRKND